MIVDVTDSANPKVVKLIPIPKDASHADNSWIQVRRVLGTLEGTRSRKSLPGIPISSSAPPRRRNGSRRSVHTDWGWPWTPCPYDAYPSRKGQGGHMDAGGR